MADQATDHPKKALRKKGLPPISAKETEEEPVTKTTKRRPKKKTNDENTPPTINPSDKEVEGDKPVPKRRRKRSPSQAKGDEPEEAKPSADATPRKKKKKPKAQTTGEEDNQNANAQEKDGQGSKTSLISKEGGTPRKKTVKKKKKKVKTEGDVDEFGESPWADDLRTLEEDIITGEGQEEEVEEEEQTGETGTEKMAESKKGPLTFLTAPVLRSQPMDKIFIETSSKFKGQNKSVIARQRQEETARSPDLTPAEIPRRTTIDFAISSHKIFRVFSLFLHGLTAGLLLWQMIIVYVLSSSSFSDDDFLEHYYRVSMPLQAALYFLLVLGTVSACDRFDIGNPTRRFFLRALTLQNGAVAIVFSLIALILNMVLIKYDDKMYLYKDIPELYVDESEKSDDISTFRSLNAARSVMVVLCWLVLSITPTTDRLGKNLRSGETGLEVKLELDRVSAA